MKNVLTLLLLVLGTSAFANTGKNTEPKPVVENHETTACKKAACKPAKALETTVARPASHSKEKHQPGTTKTCTTVEKASFGISGYFVDFIHNSNVKLVKLLID